MKIKIDVVIMKMAEKKLSRGELSQKSGIEYGTLCHILQSGRKRVNPVTAGKLADGLECEVSEIAIPDVAIN